MVTAKSEFRRETTSAAWSAVIFLIVQIYFWMWSWKKDKGKYFKYSALSLLSLSTISLGLEVGFEIAGPQRLSASVLKLLQVAHNNKIPAGVGVGLCVAAVLYVVVHHFHEARKPDYEFNFAMRLCECIESPRILGGEDQKQHVKRALELIYSVFRRAGARHVCLHTIEGQELVIQPDNVFPSETDPEYFVRMKPGEGVAGRVFSDQQVRYMPRLRLMSMAFPHAVNFEYRLQRESGTGEVRYEFVERRPDYFLFRPKARSRSEFKAFLSVPVRAPNSRECAAVLSVDFQRKDPIGKGDIVMAAIFGVVLADKLVSHH